MSTSTQFPSSVCSLASPFDFQTTVARVTQALISRGMVILADIDQAAAAVQAGTSLRPTRLLLFGNPRGGTPLMQANPHAALELPLKLVVWEDETQGVYIDYLNPAATLVEQYGVDVALTAPFGQVAALLGQSIADPSAAAPSTQ